MLFFKADVTSFLTDVFWEALPCVFFYNLPRLILASENLVSHLGLY